MNIPSRYQNAKWEDVPKSIREALTASQLSTKGFYLWGPIGTGKTHIAYALYAKLIEIKRSVWLWNVSELIHELKLDFDRKEKAWTGEAILGFNGILILDDIGAERISDWVAETIYLVVNKRYNEMKPTVFTSNLPVADLAERVGDRTASRIVEMCDVINLEGGDRRLK